MNYHKLSCLEYIHASARSISLDDPLELSISYGHLGASLVAQRVKCLPAMWETWVRFLGREYPLEKEIATHSMTLAGKTPWMEKPGWLQCMGSQRVRHD